MAFEERIVEIARKEGIVERIVGRQENFIHVLGKVKGAFPGLSLMQFSQHYIYTVRIGIGKGIKNGKGRMSRQEKECLIICRNFFMFECDGIFGITMTILSN